MINRPELELLAAIVNSSDDAIVSSTLEGVTTSWNPGAEQIFGYTAAEAIGRPIAMLVPVERLADDRHLLSRIAEGLHVQHFETERLRKDGTRLHVSVTLSPVHDESGTLTGLSTIIRDVTDRRRLEQAHTAEHQQAENARAKDEFLAMLGHELRNPLAPIVTALQLMRLRNGEPTHHERAVIERQVGRLVNLVDDLLDVSRITRGRVVLHRVSVELTDIVARGLEDVAAPIELYRHDVRVRIPDRGLAVDGDVERLAQVVANLLTNAAMYTSPGGRIAVSGALEDGSVVLRVQDNGMGIEPTLLPRVFDLFSQHDQGAEWPRGGLGLGLAIVRNLVALHGGSVSAESPGRGAGATFTVHLPAANGAGADPDSADASVGGTAHDAHALRVLLVDDNQDATIMLAHALQVCGYETLSAHDGAAALEAAPAFQPDVAILDLGLPLMDGYELAGRFAQHEQLRRTHLIAVTGYGQDGDRVRARAAGFARHLVKPVDLHELCATVKELAGSHLPRH